MSSVVCTLFENHYHFGVAALTNSLCKNGFQGIVCAGYTGSLPNWASNARIDTLLKWPGASSLSVSKDVIIYFLPLSTNFHLSNYKPYFILELWKSIAVDAESITYFDPDIVIKCQWNFFTKWASHGIALVYEIASDPMPSTHPNRLGWVDVINAAERQVTHKLNNYFNSGFCGVSRHNVEFVETWCHIIETGVAKFGYETKNFECLHDRTYYFYSYDQDALNIAAMCTNAPLSEVGPNGMDFIPGGWIMSHATGSPKPWKKKYLLSALKGIPPSNVDKEIWKNFNGSIMPFSKFKLKYTNFTILVASFIGRFYQKI